MNGRDSMDGGAAVYRRFPRNWYLALVGAVIVLQGGGVLFGWPPTPRILELIYPGKAPPGFESRDLTWAWAFLIVGAVLVVWVVGRVIGWLVGRRPVVRAGPDGLALFLGGPWSSPMSIPWDSVDGISAGSVEGDYGNFPTLRIGVSDPDLSAFRLWGARWTENGVLSIAAGDWKTPPREAAELLLEVRDRRYWSPEDSAIEDPAAEVPATEGRAAPEALSEEAPVSSAPASSAPDSGSGAGPGSGAK